MKKYWIVIKNTWDEYFMYRLNFLLWRVRMVIRFIITFFLWTSIYHGGSNYFGYSQSGMLTYLVLMYVVSNIVFATRTHDVGTEINEGKLTNFLLRPFNYFSYLAARDISDKALNGICMFIEIFALVLIFRPPIAFVVTPITFLLFLGALIGSITVYFLISILLGTIGFWTPEVWAPRFIFFMVFEFLSGTYFPIDILPISFRNILMLTPFPYFFYFPVSILLGRGEITSYVQGLVIVWAWITVLFAVLQVVWKKGLHIYSADGR